MTRTLLVDASAERRIGRAAAWLSARGASEPVLVVGASHEAAAEIVRKVALEKVAVFSWHRATLGRLAATLAADALAARGLAPIGALGVEALAARVVARLGEQRLLGRLAAIGDRPGLPRAAARTIRDLRHAGLAANVVHEIAPEIGDLLAAYEEELARDRLADRALVFETAASVETQALLGLPTLLLDVPVQTRREEDLVLRIAARSPELFSTVVAGDERTAIAMERALGIARTVEPPDEVTSLSRVRAWLFEQAAPPVASAGDDVAILSAPGESRECVELARRIRGAGIPFDRIAILLRSPARYRAHLEEALRRAGVPAYFAAGTRRPDPAGRAMLALLACADEGLSARRFAEYLSLGEVPPDNAGAPPAAPPSGDRWAVPDDEMTPAALGEPGPDEPDAADATEDPLRAVVAGGLRAPWRWERLLVDAAVIGGRGRWERRLSGLANELVLDLAALDDPTGPIADSIRKSISDLEALRGFALPLLGELEALRAPATWGEWTLRLTALATRAIRRPERVLSVLASFAPMAPLGPVSLGEVQLVLGRRLTDLVIPPPKRREGAVFVGAAEDARGMAFDLVLVPGLAEKIFPQKVSEDPLLRDRARALLPGLQSSEDAVQTERLALRLATGAARRRLVLSYPRLDVENTRPRVPSFYALEVLRAAEGKLPGFDDLAERAERASEARIGWPAPRSPQVAIDESEHDLALLHPLLFGREPVAGGARYLLGANPHLGRALRFRARRWLRRWTSADGLVEPGTFATEALAAHALSARSYSPTALQNYASCPYKFLLYAVHKLAPREEPEAIEEMDPLQKGSLVHEVLFELLEELRRDGRLPVTKSTLDEARGRLDRIVDEVAGKYRDLLAPAIDRVWDDGISSVRADLREFLRRAADDESGWIPWRFELSFGLKDRRSKDPASTDDPALLDCGIRLRGSIDLVEKSASTGRLRVTDYKTGKVRAEKGAVVGGGETLQPVLYALTLEKIFPEAGVDSGRLYYLTTKGAFEERTVPLSAQAREHAEVVARTIEDGLARGFLPAAPAEGACRWCDYRVHCGPREEERTKRKPVKDLGLLRKLRDLE